jgi:hypothetical protein
MAQFTGKNKEIVRDPETLAGTCGRAHWPENFCKWAI